MSLSSSQDRCPRGVSDHGTHVAGIIGARKPLNGEVPEEERSEYANGMCPDIQLYDFQRSCRVGGHPRRQSSRSSPRFNIIRHMNERNDHITIHGANLSLSIPHDVRNYACGRTPVCTECERLVDSGVVVVAAAGNFGYQSFKTKEGSYEGYAAFSITDPGNADGVITVGATHRYSPHTYGVSFFSSRGPTGDGRAQARSGGARRADSRPVPRRLGRPRRHQHGRPACQRRGGDADGALLGTDRATAADQARSSARARPTSAGSAASRDTACLTCCGHSRASERDRHMILSLDVRRARKGDCLLLHFGIEGRAGAGA